LKIFILLCSFCSLIWRVSPGYAQDVQLTQLYAKAEQISLWQSAQWLRLLHYPSDRSGHAPSRIDGGSFFLSPSGSVDPQAEGRATLEYFFNRGTARNGESPHCSYPARFVFLEKQLPGFAQSVDRSLKTCAALTRWLDGMRPAGVTLVFPVSYMNNPASMFGHTLLRIDSHEFSPQHPLLTAAIGFAATTDEEQGIPYAFKGIFGGYEGRFSAEPYYVQARRYGELENRDIWEYPLTLTAEETRFLLLHVWELQQAFFDYYFFDENCSFQLLSLLEVVRPTLQFTRNFPLWALPVDTVREVVDQLGNAQQVRYRPSLRSQLLAQAQVLRDEQIAQAKNIADGGEWGDALENGVENSVEQARLLQFAHDYLQYRNLEHGDHEDTINELAHAINTRRSDLPPVANPAQAVVPEIRPEQGHEAARLDVGLGVRGDQPYVELGLRPVFHDLFDPPGGYETGQQIEVLYPTFRYYPERELLELESLKLLDITSVTPATAVSSPISWKTQLFVDRYTLDSDDSDLFLGVNAGFGLSHSLTSSSYIYGLVGAEALGSEYFPNLVDGGPALFAGLHFSPGKGITAGVKGKLSYLAVDNHELRYNLIALSSFPINKTSSVRAEMELDSGVGDPSIQVAVRYHYFFRL